MGIGYIKFFRKIKDWEHYKDPNTKAVFIHFLINAVTEKTDVVGGVLNIGECKTSIHSLSEELGISEWQARNAVRKLTETGEITVKRINARLTVVHINNFVNYQKRKPCPRNFPQANPHILPQTNPQYNKSGESANLREFYRGDKLRDHSISTGKASASATVFPSNLHYYKEEYKNKEEGEERREARARLEKTYGLHLTELYIEKAEAHGKKGEEALTFAALWLKEDRLSGKLPPQNKEQENKSYDLEDFFQAAINKKHGKKEKESEG